MYAERTARHLPFHPPAPPAHAMRASLRSQLHELAQLLSGPIEDRAALRASVQDVQRAMLHSGTYHGLLALLLRNMLVDLAGAPGRFDAAYFAQQLGRVAEEMAG